MILKHTLPTLIAMLVSLTAEAASAPADRFRPASAATDGNGQAEARVDRIEMEGVTQLSDDEIATCLEFQPGDRVTREKVEQSIENLREAYGSRGYPRLALRTEYSAQTRVFTFFVKEGLPTRVSEIGFTLTETSNSEQKESFRLFWLRMENKVRKKISLHAGDLFEKDKIQTSKKQILDALASSDFLTARVIEVRVTAGVPRDEKTASGSDWVKVLFVVDPGERVTFGFRGNTLFTSAEMSGWIKELRSRGFSDNYMSDIRKRVEDEYRKIAHPHAFVEVLTFEDPKQKESHVTFLIHEEALVEIDRIDFDGQVQLTAEVLRKEFFKRATESVEKGTYVATEVNRSAEYLVEWMRSQGFLSAELVSVSPVTSPDKTKVRATIHLHEGERTFLDAIRLDGLQTLKREKVLGFLELEEGKPLNLFAFTQGLEKLKTDYRNRGYLDFQISNENSADLVSYLDENRHAEIDLHLEEGPLFTVSRIEVEGLVKTKKKTILNEIPVREKKVLTEKQLTESEVNLKRLGIFSAVEVQIYTDPAVPTAKVVKIKITEGTPGVWGVGGGIRNDLGVRGFGSVAYTNLMGRNHTIQLAGALNRRFDYTYCRSAPCFVEYQFQLTYNVPHLFTPGLALRPRATVENIRYFGIDSAGQNNGFDAFVISSGFTLEKKVFPKPLFVVALDYNLERIAQSNARLDTDNRTLTIGSITPSARLDLRDSPLSPTRGFFSQISFEWASKYLGSQVQPSPVGYTRFQFRADGHIPLGKVGSWYLSFRTGFARNLEVPPDPLDNTSTDYAIPISKLFVLGGVGSIRGLPERALFTDYAIRGTLSYVNYRTQLDLPLFGDLRFGPFLDAGGLHVDSFTFGDLRWGAGVGLRYMSPVGPINFDVGFNLFPRGSEASQQIYFSIGVI